MQFLEEIQRENQGASAKILKNQRKTTKTYEKANKIDELIKINDDLQKNLLEMQQNVLKNLIKYITDTVIFRLFSKISRFSQENFKKTADLTNLRATVDVRFSKLEKTIEKICSLNTKTCNFSRNSQNKAQSPAGDCENNFTISLNFEKDRRSPAEKTRNHAEISQWNKAIFNFLLKIAEIFAWKASGRRCFAAFARKTVTFI